MDDTVSADSPSAPRSATPGPLSRAFISADDAAYWAHKKIGSRRDREYGGVILKNPAGRYFATEPLRGKALYFDLHEVLKVGADGRFEQPEGYSVVATYHSHPADHELTQKFNRDFDSRMVKAYLGFFSDGDFWHAVNNRGFFQSAYLSGPDGSLIRYTPSGSAAEFSFALWIKAGRVPVNSKVAVFGPFDTFIKKISTLGTLGLVVPTSLWGGSVGDVPADWVVFKPFSRAVPTPAPLFTGIYRQAWEAADACERGDATGHEVGIVIKAQGKEEYAASQLEPAVVQGWLADGTLPALPVGWQLEGMYLYSRPPAEHYPGLQAWLYKSFINPLELATQIAGYRRFAQAGAAASLFILTTDDAVLRYRFSGSAAESQLFTRAADGSVSDNGLQMLLQGGTLLTRAFVSRVAQAGQLSVEKPGMVWDKAGIVDDAWRPFSRIPQPRLSPAFITADDAARWAHEQISQRHALEHGGVILKRGSRYYATHPVSDRRNVFDHGLLLGKDSEQNFIAPDDYTAEAFYHSHPAVNMAQARINFPAATDDQLQVLGNFFSIPDQRFSFRNRAFAKAHYLSGPDNVLLKYVSSGSAAEKAYQQELLGAPTAAGSDFEAEHIWKLAEAGELWVLIANALWGGVRGRITQGWRISTPAVAVPHQPFFTQVFPSAELAVLRGLLPSGSPQAGQAGFVLKHLGEDAYVATLAQPKSQPLFSPQGVFPNRADGQVRLPSQYRLEAIYFSSWYEKGEITAKETWLASTFFTPGQVVAATRQARATLKVQESARGLSLYMQASDDALLKFQVPEATTSSELVRQNSAGQLDDNGAQAAMVAGTLSPRDYVRRVIAAADLTVVQPGGLWRQVGRVESRSDLLTAFYQAALSRSFLSARDAAVYAHEQIGNRRDRHYGGYVLKGEDGRFVITEPMQSAVNPFAFTLFFPNGNRGPLIPPEPYVLHGRYGSHPELSMLDPAGVLQLGWTRDEALINQQVFSADEMYSIIPAGRVAYLSAAPDCLLEYTPTNSSHEQLLLANVGPLAADNSLQRRIASGRVKPAEWVWRLAEAGHFNIIQGNPFWGRRSPIYNDWTPDYSYVPSYGPPDYVTFGAVYASADEAARNLHARVHGRNLPEQACFAFILKHKDKDHYVASEVVGASTEGDLFNLNRVFERVADDGYRLPDGFVLHGLFRSQQWARTGLNTSSAWLTLYFVTPRVLFTALYEANRGGAKNLPIYLSTLEGALLRYVASPIDVTNGGVADQLLTLAQQQLDSGQKTPVAFIREWAIKGRLVVLRVSQCWDKPGFVSSSWEGYATLMPRRLSPAFVNPDDAARHAAALVNNGHRRAYGGVILRLVNGLFAATEPMPLPPQGFALNWIYPDSAVAVGLYPGGSTIVARYRSLVDQEPALLLSATQKALYKSMIPSGVLSALLHREVHIKREYVFGLNGTILSYQLSDSAEESRLKTRLAPLNPVKGDYADNSIEQQLRSGALLPQAWVTEVARSGDLRVVEGDSLWGQSRKITTQFTAHQYRPAPQEVRQVFSDSPCSPVFTQALDAVRQAQRQWTPGAEVGFGYVLKSVSKPLYMTTRPLVREKFTDLAQVFINGQLPQGYRLDGLYLCASTMPIAPAEDEMARSFFAPQYIAEALNFITHVPNGSVLALYLLCADGAMLAYSLPRAAPVYEWASKAHLDRVHLLEGSLTVRDYVRSLAAAGGLYIRVTSEVWGRKERVTSQWEAKRAPHAFADDPHFHSFCGPLFLYPDDAARYAQGLVAPFRGKQYLGAILVPERTPGYVAIDPVEDQGMGGGSTLALLFWIGHAGFDVPAHNVLKTYRIAAVQAFYKVIPSTSSREQIDKNLLNHFVSKDDLRDYLDVIKSNAPDAQSCYLSCRGGALLKYVPVYTPAETMLLSPGQAPDPSVLVSQLRARGSLSVLVADAFWTRQGLLGQEWSVGELQAEPVVDDFWYAKDEL